MLSEEKLALTRFSSWCIVCDNNVAVLDGKIPYESYHTLVCSQCNVLRRKTNSSQISILVHCDWWQRGCARWKTKLWILTHIIFHSLCNDLRMKINSSHISNTVQCVWWQCGCVTWKNTLWKITHISFHSSCHVVKRKTNSN